MLRKIKTPTTYTIEAATAELDVILAKAAEAFVPADRLGDFMEGRIAAIRARRLRPTRRHPELCPATPPQ
jgi:hypothetical protein